MTASIILGTGSYTPDKIITNDDMSKIVDTSDEWIKTRTGICQRRFAAAGRAQNDNTAAPEGYGACVQKLRHFLDRKPHDETRAQRLGGDVGLGGANVLGPDHPVMRLDDLFRDR